MATTNQFIFDAAQTDHNTLCYKIVWIARDYHLAQSFIFEARQKVAEFQYKNIG